MFPEVDTEEGYGSLYFFIHEGVILVLGGDAQYSCPVR